MSRKNSNHSYKRSGRKGRSFGASAFPIDWDRAAAAHNGVEIHEERWRGGRLSDRKPDKPHNEFMRKLIGFDDSALEFMAQYRLDEVDDTGGIPVWFEGISSKPKTRIELTKLGLVISRGGLVVVSGVVSAPNKNEVGLGESREIKRTSSEPALHSHNASNRFNVALGRQPAGIKEHEIAGKILGDNAIALSSVLEVNGQQITPSMRSHDIDLLWERREQPQPWGSDLVFGSDYTRTYRLGE